jgi:hypothetical protein
VIPDARDGGNRRAGESGEPGVGGLQAGQMSRARNGFRDGGVFKLLDYSANVARLTRRRARFVQDLALRWGKHTPNAVDEFEGILMGPEVNVERVEFVMVFVLIVGVVGWEMPLVMPVDLPDSECHNTGVLVRVVEVDVVEVWYG